MTYTVTVTEDGRLQLADDRIMCAPLTVEAVQALAAAIPDAQRAIERGIVTSAARELTALFAAVDAPELTVTVTAGALEAYVDDQSFQAIQAAWGVEPDDTGALTRGPVTVHPTKDKPDNPHVNVETQ